jgi:Flp pilus assembly protein TadG
MRWIRSLLRQKSGEDGVVTLEFVLIALPMFLLLLCMADFGHAFYMRQIITDGAREGARYGVVFTSPKRTETQIQTYVTTFLTGIGITPDVVNVSGAGGNPGDPLTVQVQATKTWFVLDSILGPTTQMTATSTMRNE